MPVNYNSFMGRSEILIDSAQVAEFCRRWGLRELSIFGSAAQGTMGPQSDVDVLIKLPAEQYPDVDDWDAMRDELSKLFGRPVDLMSARKIENPFVRHQIMTHRKVLYAA